MAVPRASPSRRPATRSSALPPSRSSALRTAAVALSALLFANCAVIFLLSSSPSFQAVSTASSLESLMASFAGGGYGQELEGCARRQPSKAARSDARGWRSGAGSLFNCDLDAAECRYFNPLEFFCEDIGRRFSHQVRDGMELHGRRMLWNNMPPPQYSTVTLDNVCFGGGGGGGGANVNNNRQGARTYAAYDNLTLTDIGEHNATDAGGKVPRRCLTERISSIHVHKSGGTSVREAVNYLGRRYIPGGGRAVKIRKWLVPERRAIFDLNETEVAIFENITAGTRIETWYPNDSRWYEAVVLRRLPNGRPNSYAFKVHYVEDDEDQVVDLATEKVRVLSFGGGGGEGKKKDGEGGSGSEDEEEYYYSEEDREAKRRARVAALWNSTKESLSHAVAYPAESFGPHEHVLFGVVRDPTERFISSIGQAFGGKGSGRNVVSDYLKRECIQATPAETLKCTARLVKEKGHWIELHFAPQVIDISFTVMNEDVPVAIFNYSSLKRILAYLNADTDPLAGGAGAEFRKRDRPHRVLNEMTVEDYDEESLRLVCEIYEMDVVMQRSLGFQVPSCDPYV